MTTENPYDDEAAVAAAVTGGRHREIIGGLWEELGKLQLDFLISHGLEPQSYLLDVGCGCLRGGVHFARYLAAGHYFGVDRHQPLLDAGLSVELPSVGLQNKVPPSNLLCTESFEFEKLGRSFDFALAQSLFTHLPLNTIRLCLAKLSHAMPRGGKFFATFFERPDYLSEHEPLHHARGGTTTYSWRDPYHYRPREFAWLAESLPWRLSYIGEWNHPRDQKMLLFERL